MPKRDLVFAKPLMNAAGTLGFAPDGRGPVALDEFGAFVTNPISLRRRRAAASPALIEYPGGFLLHNGLPNPGFNSTLRKYGRRWQDAALPVVVHLMADRPEESRQMVHALERYDNVMAVELGFAPLLADEILLLAVEMCRGEVPLIVSLPAQQLLDAGGRLLDAGAAAFSIAAPRGSLPGTDGALVSGRLYGPSLFPGSLELVHAAARLGLPVIAAGGVRSKEDAASMLQAGALAVQLDYPLWLPV